MRLWLIPSLYAIASVIGGFVFPRLENQYFPLHLNLSVASAQAYLSAVASGMMALTGIVFSIAFVMVQFSAIAYSPRLVIWFARDRSLFHAMGVFVATFMYSLSTLAWVDRAGQGVVPMVSCLIVALMLVASVLLFSQLVQRIGDLQITQVLRMIGDTGRDVIAQTYRPLPSGAAQPSVRPVPRAAALPVTQSVTHLGGPRTVVRLDTASLLRQARLVDGVIVMTCAVGDTLFDQTRLLRVHGGNKKLPDEGLRQAVIVGGQRTFEQDPKYALRLLVDIAIKALSPAINDPTTAVQAIDQIEDLLRRLGKCDLDYCEVADQTGTTRVIVQMPTWSDYLSLAFDEIRQYGASSVQVMRRLRSTLTGLAANVGPDRADSVRRYLEHLDLSIDRSTLDPADRETARVEDRQGLGLSHKRDVGEAAG